jgi:hypothetical protein
MIEIEELAKDFEFTLWSTCNSSNGKSYQYMDKQGINIIFNEWDQSFELKWLIPRSIFTIECPSCSPYTNKEHFTKIYTKFWKTIFSFNTNMPAKYVNSERYEI